MFADRVTDVGVHDFHRFGLQIGLGIKQRERALFFGQLNRRQIRRTCDCMQPFIRFCSGFVCAVFQACHQQSICQTCHTQTDAAFVLRFDRLLGQWKVRCVDNVVHHANCSRHQFIQNIQIDLGVFLERIFDQTGQVDRTQQTRAIGRQGLFATWVRRGDGFTIMQVVRLVDAVDKNHAWLCKIIGGFHDLVPKIKRVHSFEHFAFEYQIP